MTCSSSDHSPSLSLRSKNAVLVMSVRSAQDCPKSVIARQLLAKRAQGMPISAILVVDGNERPYDADRTLEPWHCNQCIAGAAVGRGTGSPNTSLTSHEANLSQNGS